MYHKISVKAKNLTSKFQFSNRKFLILFAFTCMWIYMQDSLMQLWIPYKKIDTFALRVLAKQMERIWRRHSQIYRFHQRRYYRPSENLKIVSILLHSSCSRNLGEDNGIRLLCLKLITRLITEDYNPQLVITGCQNGALKHSWFSQMTSHFYFFCK